MSEGESCRTISTSNPFTGERIADYRLEPYEEVMAKVAGAREVFLRWKALPVSGRVEILGEALGYFEARSEDIARDISMQMGRPLAHARGEINGLLERGRYLLSIAEAALAPDPLPAKEGFDRAITHEPLGVVFVISAWNYPLLIAINGVMAALVAGNAVLFKHSSLTLSIGRHFAEAFGHLEGYEGLLQDAVMDHATTGRVIESGGVDHVVFTGSVGGGKTIYAHVAKALIGCNLELGGKDGAYVAADADVGASAEALVDGAMYNAGQSCCGVERVYVHESVYDDFLERATSLVRAYRLGDPLDPETTMGPLSTAKAAVDMRRQVEDAVAAGARIVAGGTVEQIGQGTFFAPTLIVDVTHDMALMQEENFGPILPVMKVASDEEAVRLVNDSCFGLTSIICTRDRDRAAAFYDAVDTGTVFMNRCDYLDPALCWTGRKATGRGGGLSVIAYHNLTRPKSYHLKKVTK